MTKELTIPVEPMVKKFLVKHYGTKKILLSRADFISHHLITLLKSRKKIYRYRNRTLPDCSITFLISHDYAKRYGNSISHDDVSGFNEFIKMYIRSVFRQSMFFQLMHCNDMKNSILIFMDHYGFTDNDIDYETLKKDYYRFENNSLDKQALFST